MCPNILTERDQTVNPAWNTVVLKRREQSLDMAVYYGQSECPWGGFRKWLMIFLTLIIL
jgi:hypothetical protein